MKINGNCTDGREDGAGEEERRAERPVGVARHVSGGRHSTVVGVDDDGSLKFSEGGDLYDDRPQLTAIAKIASAYYSTPRRAIEFSLKCPVAESSYHVGHMINRIGDQTNAGEGHDTAVNSVITEIKISMQIGRDSGKAGYVTTVNTWAGEIDGFFEVLP